MSALVATALAFAKHGCAVFPLHMVHHHSALVFVIGDSDSVFRSDTDYLRIFRQVVRKDRPVNF